MFSATPTAPPAAALQSALAQQRAEAVRLNRQAYVQLQSRASPAKLRPTTELVELAPVVEPEDPRLRFHVARLRALIDRRRPSDIQQLLQGRPHLLKQHVRIGPAQTALEYAMDRGLEDIVTVLQASESAVRIEES